MFAPQTKYFEEIGAIFSIQLVLQKRFAKITNKKVIAKIQCEKN